MQDPHPLISIALCTYNGERFIRQQLDSLVKQAYKNIEIVAVDDHSSDQTVAILEEYKCRFNNIRIFQNDANLGFRKNFEKALRECNGEYIALSDQDDIWRSDKIAVQMNMISDNILVYHDSAFVDENGKMLGKNLSDVMKFYSGSQCHYFLFENCISGHTCLFHRSLLTSLLPLPANMYHDRWLGFVASSRGTVDFSNEPLVQYRQHRYSNTDILRKKKIKKQSGQAKILEETEQIGTFREFSPGDPFIEKLHSLLHKRLHQYLSVKLFLFVFRHRKTLYYFKRKSRLSKFAYCLKYLWGYRLKKALS